MKNWKLDFFNSLCVLSALLTILLLLLFVMDRVLESKQPPWWEPPPEWKLKKPKVPEPLPPPD